MKMDYKALDDFADKLVNWYDEGCEISREINEKQDYYEIVVKDTNGVKTYQEFNYYIGNKLWNIYLDKLGRYHANRFPLH